jgi:hypothetical protein
MNRCYFHKNFPNSGQIVSTVLATSETLQAPAAEFWAVGFSEYFGSAFRVSGGWI